MYKPSFPVLYTFVANHGKPVREMTVRGLTTQHKPGTLSISACGENVPEIERLGLSELLPQTDVAQDEEILEADSIFCSRQSLYAVTISTAPVRSLPQS